MQTNHLQVFFVNFCIYTCIITFYFYRFANVKFYWLRGLLLSYYKLYNNNSRRFFTTRNFCLTILNFV